MGGCLSAGLLSRATTRRCPCRHRLTLVAQPPPGAVAPTPQAVRLRPRVVQSEASAVNAGMLLSLTSEVVSNDDAENSAERTGLTPRSVRTRRRPGVKLHSSAKTGSCAESSGGADLPRKLDAFFNESRWGRQFSCNASEQSTARLHEVAASCQFRGLNQLQLAAFEFDDLFYEPGRSRGERLAVGRYLVGD